MATLSELRNQAKQSGTYKGMNRAEQTRNVGASMTSAADVPTKYYEQPKSNVAKFAEWGKNVAVSGAKIGAAAAVGTAKYVKNAGVDIYQDAFLAGRSLTTDYFGKTYKNVQIADNMKELDKKSSDIVAKYKSGQMSKEDYIKANRELSAAYGSLGKQSEDVAAGPSPAERAEAIVSTGINILSLGRLSLGKQALVQGGETVIKKGATSYIDDAARAVEQQFMKNGAFRSLIERNLATEAKLAGSKTTSEFIARNSKQIASDLLIKRPLFYQSNISDAKNLLVGVLEKKPSQALSSAAWLGIQMLDGGPLGAFFKYGNQLKVRLGQLAYGADSFIDTVSREIGNGNPSQISRFLETLQNKAPDAYKKAVQTFRIAQEMNLRASSDDVGIASRNFLQTYIDSGVDLRNVTPSQLFKDMNNWVDADNAWQNAVKKGLIPDMDMIEASRFTPVRWDNKIRDSVAETVKNAESPEQALDAIRKMADKPGNGWGNNENLVRQLEDIISKAKSSDEAAKGIKAINAAQNIPKYIPKEVKNQLTKLGYTIAEPVGGRRVPHLEPENTRKLVTSALEMKSTIPNPVLKGVDKQLIKEAQESTSLEEFIAKNTIYRGQAKDFNELQKVEQSDAISNILIGRGVFTTSDEALAKTYGDNIFTLSKPKDAKRILDLSNATSKQMDDLGISKSTQKLYKDLLSEGPDTGYYGKTYEIDGEQWRVANIVTDSKTKETQYKLANLSYGGGQKYINKAEFEAKYPPKTTYTAQKDAEEILFEQLAEKQLPEGITWNMVKMGVADALSEDLYIDDVRDKILKSLRTQGFDWIKHQGGIRAGGGDKLHDVYIALDNKVLKEVDTNKLKQIYEAAKNPIIENIDDNFEESIIPNEGLNMFANMLEDIGMSPRTSNQAANRVLSENMVANLDNTVAATIGLGKKGDIPRGGQAILNELQMFVENRKAMLGLPGKAAISDLRQLTYKEIQEALPSLKLTRNDAKQLHKAITQAYLDVPLQLRGAGDKIVDALYRYNPLHKTYSRIQSAFRYTYNPFFRVQERTETALLSRASANNLIWNQPRPVLDDAVKKLDEARIFTSSLYGEAAQDQVLGRITANITQGQKRDLAGLALDIAKKKGTTIDDMIINHADELDDALRVIVQYPKKGFLASPLARTLNLAFFPMRYNLKVTKVAAEALAKQPPYIQKAVLHSLFTMGDWLKSDEGIRWQQQHQDAIRLLNWVTPINSIAYTMNLLTNKPDELSDLGMLGGLPMGVITQILDSQGIISINNPYVDKKTGDTFPKYIPQTTKARASVAITDLLGSMFTYPGRTLGLPGKGETMRAAVKQFIATNGKDFEKRLDESQLTDLDRKWIKVLKGDMSDEAIDALYNSPAPGQYNGYTLPPLTLPFKLDTPAPRTGLPTKADLKASKGSTKKTKKIAQPIQ